MYTFKEEEFKSLVDQALQHFQIMVGKIEALKQLKSLCENPDAEFDENKVCISQEVMENLIQQYINEVNQYTGYHQQLNEIYQFYMNSKASSQQPQEETVDEVTEDVASQEEDEQVENKEDDGEDENVKLEV